VVVVVVVVRRWRAKCDVIHIADWLRAGRGDRFGLEAANSGLPWIDMGGFGRPIPGGSRPGVLVRDTYICRVLCRYLRSCDGNCYEKPKALLPRPRPLLRAVTTDIARRVSTFTSRDGE